MIRRFGFSVLFVLCAISGAGSDEAPLPPADGKPILQLEAGGPTAAVTALVFSDDGKTLYAAGLDKVVRVLGTGGSRQENGLDVKAIVPRTNRSWRLGRD